MIENASVRCAERCAQKEGRREDAAGCARSQGERRGNEFQSKQKYKELQRKVASGKNILNGRVADAFDIVMAKQRQHDAHHHAY